MDCRLEELAVVVRGDTGCWLLNGLREGAVAVKDDGEGGFILTFDNRYYEANVRVQVFDSLDKLRGFQWGGVVIQAPAIHDFEELVRKLEELEPELGDANKTLVVNHPMGRTNERMEHWCMCHHFECINWFPDDEIRRELMEMNEKWGCERLLEVLEAHQWPQAVKKLERRTGNQDLAEHLESKWAEEKDNDIEEEDDEDFDPSKIPEELENDYANFAGEIIEEFGGFVEAKLAEAADEDMRREEQKERLLEQKRMATAQPARFGTQREFLPEVELKPMPSGSWISFDEKEGSSKMVLSDATQQKKKASAGADELLRKIRAGEDCGIEEAVNRTLEEMSTEASGTNPSEIVTKAAMSVYSSWTKGNDQEKGDLLQGDWKEDKDGRQKRKVD